MLARLALVAVLASAGPAAAESVRLHAAGSLRAALTEVADAFAAAHKITVERKFGPSGLLKDEIAGGAAAGVFASANMDHPRALEGLGRAGPVVLFARNQLCALVKPGLRVTSATLLAVMRDPQVKLGMSTPKADPSGDYALEVFRRAEARAPGAGAALDAKAQRLTGGPDSAAPPQGRSVYGWHVAEGRADIFLTYCTNALAAQRENTALQRVPLPEDLAVGADYGLTVVADAPPAAWRLALYILAPAGQAVLARHGFSAPNLPRADQRP